VLSNYYWVDLHTPGLLTVPQLDPESFLKVTNKNTKRVGNRFISNSKNSNTTL